jgi:hypothetical protein
MSLEEVFLELTAAEPAAPRENTPELVAAEGVAK